MKGVSANRTSATPSLADSILLMLAITIAQRAIGLVRGAMFCRLLPPDQLGLWDVAQGFLIFAAPFVSYSIAGTFTRFLSAAEKEGRTLSFLAGAAALVVGLTGSCCIGMALAPSWCALAIYGDRQFSSAMAHLAVALASVTVFNFCTEALVGLRAYRAASFLQFFNAAFFAAIALYWLCGDPAAENVIDAYGVACALSVGVALFQLTRRLARREHTAAAIQEQAPSRLWPRVIRFAGWIWLSNGLSNLFDLVDRYMLLHLGGNGSGSVLADVGQYHASRLAPLLLVNLATLVAQAVTAHVSSLWESGRREQAMRELNTSIKLAAVVLTALAGCAQIVSPWVFGVALGGKYALGQAMFPATLMYSIWSGMAFMAAIHLWCAERMALVTACTVCGLLVNLAISALLAPLWGLSGVVLATCTANAVVLMLVFLVIRKMGGHLHVSLLFLSLILPVACLAGGWFVLGVTAALFGLPACRNWILTISERQELYNWIAAALEKTPVNRWMWLRRRTTPA